MRDRCFLFMGLQALSTVGSCSIQAVDEYPEEPAIQRPQISQPLESAHRAPLHWEHAVQAALQQESASVRDSIWGCLSCKETVGHDRWQAVLQARTGVLCRVLLQRCIICASSLGGSW
jgi:hypothetical protein